MRKKIVASYILLIVILTATFGLIMMNSVNNMMTLQLEERFISEAKIVKSLFVKSFEQSENDNSSFDYMTFANQVHMQTNTRITIILEDGTVVADTSQDPKLMNNHLNRDEVQDAIRKNDVTTKIRYSNTVGSDFMYVAIPVEIEDSFWVIRVSKRLTEIEALNIRIIKVALYSMIGAAIVALIMSVILSKRMTKPIDALTNAAEEIANGDFGKKIYIQASDQIGELAQSFNKMSRNLEYSVNELKKRNIELEAILNSMINGIIAVDQNKNIILINRFCFEILDLPLDYVVENESMYKIIRNDEIAQMVEQSMKDGLSQVKELAYVHSDKILRIYVNPIFTADKEIMGSIVVIQDITQIRKLEQMRSDFVSNVSHELKTPLTSIKGFVDTLKNGAIENPETALRFLDIIDIESDRLYRLINDILLLSEIESMDREPELTEFELRSVVEEVLDILSQSADAKGLTISTNFETRIQLNANRDRIKQMLINLVDNAIKYTEKGSVTIGAFEDQGLVKIIVSDTGIGFDDIHKSRLFERFYRVDKGRSRNQGGTGLGLSIVKHIVLLYQGKITVNSTPGKGTTFEVQLPNRRKND